MCEVFSAALGATFKRNIGQSRDGGNDANVGPLVLEMKRRKTLGTVEGWLLQAAAACDNSSQYPVVVCRSDGGKSMVIVDLDHFLEIAGDWLREQLLEIPPVDRFIQRQERMLRLPPEMAAPFGWSR